MKTRVTIKYPVNDCRLCGTAIICKLKNTGTLDELPIRPIISNIGTASYQLTSI